MEENENQHLQLDVPQNYRTLMQLLYIMKNLKKIKKNLRKIL